MSHKTVARLWKESNNPFKWPSISAAIGWNIPFVPKGHIIIRHNCDLPHIGSVIEQRRLNAVNKVMDSNYLACLFVCWFYLFCDVFFVVLLIARFKLYFLFLSYYYSVYCGIYANKDIYIWLTFDRPPVQLLQHPSELPCSHRSPILLMLLFWNQGWDEIVKAMSPGVEPIKTGNFTACVL